MRTVIPAIERSSQVELIAFHTRSADVRAEATALTGAIAHQNYDSLLGAENVDAVYIASPTGVHAEMAMHAIDAGKHVWCEKPLTGTEQETVALLDAADESGIVVLESDMFLHHPQFEVLRQLVSSGEVGNVRSVTGRFGFPHLDETNFRYSPHLGGGALLDAGYYPVAAAVGLLGPDLELIGATIERPSAFDVDTGGTALATNGGAAAIMDWGFGRSYRNEIEVWGEDGVLSTQRAFSKPFDLPTTVVVQPHGGDLRTIEIDAADQFALMMNDFADITTGRLGYVTDQIRARARLLTQIRGGNTSA
jgi:predicted dehydrogenase